MPRIHVLTEELANRIAAGEVVERPASVVKELVENSVDAGAHRIEVDLEDGGKKLIRVRDDGHGMTCTDATLAVQRFATSKIGRAEDLEAIDTMGFRGEALPSIAAVSHFRLVTREPQAAEGCEVTIHGGGPAQVKPAGCPAGTTLQVTDLFFNTPARAKFLATSGRERGHCADWVTRLALSRPDIAFKLTHNGEVLFSSAGTGDLRSVLAAIYGSTAAREFLEVDRDCPEGVRIVGLVSGPKLLRGTRAHQMFFVNRRFVRSRQMSHALSEGYGLLLPAGKHPLCAIHLTVEPGRVDPNVHPTKIEVRFRRPGMIHQLVQQATEQALADAGFRSLVQGRRHVSESAPDPLDGVPAAPGDPFSSPGPRLAAGRGQAQDYGTRLRARRLRVNPFEDRIDERDEGLNVHASPVVELPPLEQAQEPSLAVDAPPEKVRALGQLADRYIVCASAVGLLLVDQHRAGERVIMERLGPERVSSQLLVVPETLKLSAGEAAAAQGNMQALTELGYELEEFGKDTLLVRAVPSTTAEGEPIQVLQGLISDLAEFDQPTSAEHRRERARATLACHAAIKAGERMALPEMQRLVDDLLESQSPAVCPHGDPIIVSFDIERLDQQFKRG